MFNERDWRCAAVQLLFSTDPSYDNRTIASTLKMQIWTVQRLRAQRIGQPFGGGGVEAQGWGHCQEDPDKWVHQKGPGNHWWNSQRPIRQIARDLGISHTTVNACVNEDLKCRSYWRQTSQILTEKTKNLRLIKSVRLLTWTRWTTSYVENTNKMTSHNNKASLITAIRQVFAELPTALVEKTCPSSGSVSRWWLRLKAATLNRCQLYYIIKLTELIFSLKVLK